jgi:hypothetical protein
MTGLRRKGGKNWFGLLLICLLLIPRVLEAQKARGLSEPGRLGFHTNVNEADASKIVCTLEFKESSGDGILSECEEGIVLVNVRNFHEKLALQLKLEFMMQAGRYIAPIFKIESLGQIPPGRMVQFKETLKWHDHLPPGSVTVRVKVMDSKTQIKSSPFQLRFRIRGPAKPVDRNELRWKMRKPGPEGR